MCYSLYTTLSQGFLFSIKKLENAVKVRAKRFNYLLIICIFVIEQVT